jgi:hypothetical protein
LISSVEEGLATSVRHEAQGIKWTLVSWSVLRDERGAAVNFRTYLLANNSNAAVKFLLISSTISTYIYLMQHIKMLI